MRLHYVDAGTGPRTIILIHGFPQTWWEWRRVIGPLVEKGWRVVAPDYRGAGASSKPQDGYDIAMMVPSPVLIPRPSNQVYRAFDKDAADNRAALKEKGPLRMPVLAIGGASSFFAPIARDMLGEVATHVTCATLPRCGHWIAEENPLDFLGALNGFLAGA